MGARRQPDSHWWVRIGRWSIGPWGDTPRDFAMLSERHGTTRTYGRRGPLRVVRHGDLDALYRWDCPHCSISIQACGTSGEVRREVDERAERHIRTHGRSDPRPGRTTLPTWANTLNSAHRRHGNAARMAEAAAAAGYPYYEWNDRIYRTHPNDPSRRDPVGTIADLR